jgi:polysaccharide biosynthesis protein PslH
MRILQLCNRIPYPPHDGGAIAILQMATAFQKLGCTHKMLAFNTKKHFISHENLPDIIRNDMQLETVELDASVKAFPALMNLFSRESYNISRFDKAEFREKLKAELQKNTYDVVHIEGLFMSMYVDLIRENSNALISMRAHNVEYMIWKRMAETQKAGLKKWYLKLLAKRLEKYERAVLNKPDVIIPITEVDAAHYREMGCRQSMHVAPAAVDTESFVPDKTKTEAMSVFHLGALDWLPNQQAIRWFIDRVWPLVLKKVPEAKFYIAGRHMPDWVLNLKRPNVHITGEVENAVDFMNEKAVMIVPLLSGSGMRLKIVEGMALEKAIVSTSVGAEGINYQHEKDIFIADEAEAFAKAVIRCLNEREKAEKIGKNARRLVCSQYSNEAIVKELLDFYKKSIT